MATDVFPVIGMSPGNSYFKDEEVRYLLREIVGRYGRTAILVADTPAISTYKALGYPETKARSKAILKGNNLKNRTKRIMQELGFGDDVVKIIEWDEEVKNDLRYQAMYERVMDLYAGNAAFEKTVEDTTAAVLRHSEKRMDNIEESTKTATHYLLSELAFLGFAPEFLRSTNVTYVYHKNWPVYEDYIAGRFDGQPKLHLDFLLLEHPTETYVTLEPSDAPADANESTYERILRTKCIRASYEEYVPAFMADAATGSYSGIFHDILKRFADEHGLSVRFTEQTGYGVIIEGLDERRFDIFATTVWPTPERLRRGQFSIPVYYSDAYMWVRQDTLGRDPCDPQFRIAIKQHDISDSIASEDYPQARLVYVPQLADTMSLLRFVAEGKADGTFVEPYLAAHFNKTSRVRLVRSSGKPVRRYGNTFMFKQGEDTLKEELDRSIQQYVETGYVRELIAKYTGSADTFEGHCTLRAA